MNPPTALALAVRGDAWTQEVLLAEAAVRAELLAFGVHSVFAEYGGAFDDSQVDLLMFLGAPSTGEITIHDAALRTRIEQLFFTLLDARHEGWSIGEGGFGHFDWHLDTGALKHKHSARYLAIDVSYHDGFGLDPA